MAIAVRQWPDDVYHNVAESLVRHFELARVDQFGPWSDFIAGIATFHKYFYVTFQAGPVVLSGNPCEGWFDAQVVEME